MIQSYWGWYSYCLYKNQEYRYIFTIGVVSDYCNYKGALFMMKRCGKGIYLMVANLKSLGYG